MTTDPSQAPERLTLIPWGDTPGSYKVVSSTSDRVRYITTDWDIDPENLTAEQEAEILMLFAFIDAQKGLH